MKVLITGANRGLGLALTHHFLQEGHQVFATYRSKGEDLAHLESLYQKNHQLRTISCDVAEEAQIKQAKKELEQWTDSIDILINNAAVHLEQGRPDIGALDFSVYLPTLAVNSVAPLMMVQHMLPLLQKGQGKTIISISSEAGSIGNCWREREYSYCMSKAALNMAMRILQNRLGKEGFRIRLIHPGWVQTDMGGKGASLSPAESARAVYQRIMETVEEGMPQTHPLYIDWEGKPLPW
ncbi:SDR family oxidoreductase [Treponema sp. J25]|uniref:SDR family oxidoreductase n=1 Tax=Treponema sp. J25 TaxID=2094121 RepID=UPI00104E585A|nr:SDR family oxidoreductase [Treponema sp. J25]TCW60453.1 NAD-dependent epimerase [Treponema sp. J25]